MLRRILLAAIAAASLAVPATAHAAAPSVKGGKFEVTCKPNSIAPVAIDPIVAHGLPVSAHQHTFFGRAVTPDSTPDSLQAGSGTTCVLAQDGAAYWIPTACDGPCVDAVGLPTKGTDPNDAIANPVRPVKIFAYYFGTPLPTVEAQYPANLQMVGGNAAATAPNPQMIGFSCGNGGSHSSPTRSLPYDCTAANSVKGTDGVVAIVKFPYCLEPSGGVEYGALMGGSCPAGDQTLGQVQIHVHYGLNTTGYQRGSQLNFASGPAYTFHGDWMNGWAQTKLASLVSGCIDIDKDCGFLTNTNPGPTRASLTAHATSCTVAGKVPVRNSQGFLSTHYGVNCTAGQSWTVDATVQALVSGSWVRAANTDVSTFSASGDNTVTAPVESGQWACVSGREYRSHAVLRNGNSDNSAATTLC